MNKRYIIKHCSNYEVSDNRWYEAHYSRSSWSWVFSTESYKDFLKFTDLLNEAGYKYIENQEQY